MIIYNKYTIFKRTPFTLSIKNRYNDTVNDPDATFHNDLDNIMIGLTDSFERTYNFNINQKYPSKFYLKNYIK